MSVGYKSVQWSSYKKRYDAIIGVGIAAYLGGFMVVGSLIWKGAHAISPEILAIRAFGTCAIILLHLILCIGPLCRLNRNFLPILYNRRHLGVAMFFVAMLHGVLSLGFYHGFADISPVVSLLTSNTQYRSISAFPFEILGLGALLILFLMAATSHDFWLKNLTPAVWKSLHMLVYFAWAMLILHVALGAIQSERSVLYPLLHGAGIILVSSLHLIAGRKETREGPAPPEDWIEVCAVDDITEGHGKTVRLPTGERAAVFRNGNEISAISNVCAHQGGPLGEGRIIGGCVTCPWHGYQYRANDGCAPPPFTEKLPTYLLRIRAGRIEIRTSAEPAGTAIEPARLGEIHHA
jgi:nitrite reductase/ring-hydroxylating ferredoxin subunit/DMSO/TMAO reductase YedYZ heme-binding membrane subunit